MSITDNYHRAEVERLRRERNALLVTLVSSGGPGDAEVEAILDDAAGRAEVVRSAVEGLSGGGWARYLGLPSDLGDPSSLSS